MAARRRKKAGQHRQKERIEDSPIASTKKSSSTLVTLGKCVLILALTLAVYWPALHGGFIWDDDAYVENNQTLHTTAGLTQIWFQLDANPQYYPLVHTSYWLEYHLWGLNPMGYHLVNIALHALSCILLWRLVLFLGLPGAWLVGVMFAIHPVCVESVAWITERKNTLSGFFFFASLLSYAHMALGSASISNRRKYILYASSLILFICALFSKTVTCSLPAVILLIVWWKHGRLSIKDVVKLLPFFVVGLTMGLLTAWLEKTHVGA